MLDEITNMYIKQLNNSVELLTDLSEQEKINDHSVRLMQVHCKNVKTLAEKIDRQLEEKREELTVPLSKKEPVILAQGKLKHSELLEP